MEIKTTQQVTDCFYVGNRKDPMDQSYPFESALSSVASSPVAPNAVSGGMMSELIGRLGSVCSSGENNTYAYTIPLNSPPKLNLSMVDSQIRRNFGNNPSLAPFSADPGFEERAARFSCFAAGLNGQFELQQRSMPIINTSDTIEKAELVDSEKESSVTEQTHLPGGGSTEFANSRKRKSIPRGKAKETPSSSLSEAKVAAENDGSSAKRSKQDEVNGEAEKKAEATGNGNENQKQSKENSKPTEPPKDYIHVRARRGQATDSHSLAERVRREKISERMKFLQDLVPGCNKVTGKAVMLDEIINYVQSLQRQVEFLSMKLATVNPKMDLNMESLLSKDMNQIFQTHGSLAHRAHPIDCSMPMFPFGAHLQQGLSGLTNNVDAQYYMNQGIGALHQNPSMQLPSVGEFGNLASQVPSIWEDDLQSIVQMGFSQNQPQTFHGSTVAGQLKIEL